MGPVELKPGEPRAFPIIRTVVLRPLPTCCMENFNTGFLRPPWRSRPGDVQWMTAGSGLVHSEIPGDNLKKNGGRLEGFQLWVNLPKRDKMKAPHYQELSADRIPVAESTDGKVRVKVIAGEALSVKGAVETHIPIEYLHFRLAAGAKHVQNWRRTSTRCSTL